MARESDPVAGFSFTLEVAGTTKMVGYFQEVSGIGSEHEKIEHKVVDVNGHELVQMIPGRLKWNEVTLKRGLTADISFWDWRDLVVQGDMEKARANCSIIMYDRNYNAIVRWDFINAWPSKITGPSAKTDGNEFAVEELTLVHEGMKRVK